MNLRALSGAAAEERVVHFLEARGFRVVDRNFKTKLGEIDVVAVKGRALHFVEVRSRASSRFLHPAESVDARKQAKLRRTAELYLARWKGATPAEVCFDVAAVVGDEIEFREKAFE